MPTSVGRATASTMLAFANDPMIRWFFRDGRKYLAAYDALVARPPQQ